jgi:hypothetical protein
MLGIDGKYESAELAGTGGDGAGNASSSGGESAHGNGGAGVIIIGNGGAGGVDAGNGGASPEPDAGSCTPADCSADEKCCPSLVAACVPASPLFGCSATSCDSCPTPPSNGVAICVVGKCAVQCNTGFHVQSGKCEADGAGGAGSGGAPPAGGATGAGGTKCVAANCPTCNIAGPMKCCRNDGVCGCSWAAAFACY